MNVTMHKTVAELFISMVHEEAAPVNIETGNTQRDCNGDVQVDLMLDMQDDDKTIIDELLNRAVRNAYPLIV